MNTIQLAALIGCIEIKDEEIKPLPPKIENEFKNILELLNNSKEGKYWVVGPAWFIIFKDQRVFRVQNNFTLQNRWLEGEELNLIPIPSVKKSLEIIKDFLY